MIDYPLTMQFLSDKEAMQVFLLFSEVGLLQMVLYDFNWRLFEYRKHHVRLHDQESTIHIYGQILRTMSYRICFVVIAMILLPVLMTVYFDYLFSKGLSLVIYEAIYFLLVKLIKREIKSCQ